MRPGAPFGRVELGMVKPMSQRAQCVHPCGAANVTATNWASWMSLV